jgi:hypothetical protein
MPFHPTREVEKKIFFFRAFVDEEVVRRQRDFDFESLIERVANSTHTEAGRYLDGGEGSLLSAYVDGPRQVRFGRIRRSNLPLIVDGANFEAIPVSERGGIFECCHIVYFPPATIGVEFNFYAPRTGRLAEYLRAKCAFRRRLEFRAIVARNPLELLAQFESIKLVRLKLASDGVPEIRRRHGPVSEVVDAAARSGAETVDISLSAAPGRMQPSLSRAVVNNVRNILGIPDVRGAIDKIAVKGYFQGETRLDAVDLLEDELVSKKTFLRESLRGRSLDSSQAYAQIRSAFDEIRPDQHA